MRAVLSILALTLGMLAATPCAHASRHEVYLQSGGGYFSSPARVIAGYGGGPGYRYHLSGSVAIHVELRWLGFLGNAWSFSSGATYEWAVKSWHPAIGLQLAGFLGDQVRIVSSASPDPVPRFALAMQARLAPLRFVRGSASATVLGFDVGAGVDGGKPALALLFSLLEIGFRF
jgi:hypothetical protein